MIYFPPFSPPSPDQALSRIEDDGVIIFGHPVKPAVQPAGPVTQRAAIRPLPGRSGAWRDDIWQRLKSAMRQHRPVPVVPQPAFFGHASGLRIAGAACIHRAPQS